jgi:hypothetical protein
MLNGSADGFFVDRNTYIHVLQRLNEKKYQHVYNRMLQMQGKNPKTYISGEEGENRYSYGL